MARRLSWLQISSLESCSGLESKGMIMFADNIVDGKERVEFVSTIADDGNPVT